MSDDAIAELGRQIAAMSGVLTTLNNGFVRIVTDLSELRQEVGGLRQEVADLREGQNRLAAEITRVRVEVMDRIDRLQDTITGLKNDIKLNESENERIERIALGAREEGRLLAEQVGLMRKQINLLRDDVDGLKNGP